MRGEASYSITQQENYFNENLIKITETEINKNIKGITTRSLKGTMNGARSFLARPPSQKVLKVLFSDVKPRAKKIQVL